MQKRAGRLEAARFALASHRRARGEAPDEAETDVIDLLTDLMQRCDELGLDHEDLWGIAIGHFLVERP